jgi:hypothetical protein
MTIAITIPSGAVVPRPPPTTSSATTPTSTQYTLRDRRNVTLYLSFAVQCSYPYEKESIVEPRAGNLPKRTKRAGGQRVAILDDFAQALEGPTKQQPIASPPPSPEHNPHLSLPSPPPQKPTTSAPRLPRRLPKRPFLPTRHSFHNPGHEIEVTCLVDLVPGLAVAFADDAGEGSLVTYGDGPVKTDTASDVEEEFTHIVIVCEGDEPGTSNVSVERDLSKLYLYVPTTSSDAGLTHLTAHQLHRAHSFLLSASPSLPHFHPHTALPNAERSRRVLIVTPTDRAVDAMSVAVGYLSLASGMGIDWLVGCVNGEARLGWGWRGAMSEEGVEFVQAVREDVLYL